MAHLVTIDQTRQVTSGCLLEMSECWHYGIRFVLWRVWLLTRWRMAMRDQTRRGASGQLGNASGHSMTVGALSRPLRSYAHHLKGRTCGRPRVTERSAARPVISTGVSDRCENCPVKE
jgi:hypothetical protein